MIFEIGRAAFTANRFYSLAKLQQRHWWHRRDFQRNMHLLLNKALVNGEWISAATNAEFAVKNPANGSIVGHVPDFEVSDVQKAIDAAYETFHSTEWSSLTAKERSALLKVRTNVKIYLKIVSTKRMNIYILFVLFFSEMVFAA